MKNITEYLITESNKTPQDKLMELPKVTELGLGTFDGILWGHCFLYEGKKYYSEYGWKSVFPMKCRMEINEEQAFPYQVDKYQYRELKQLYEE